MQAWWQACLGSKCCSLVSCSEMHPFRRRNWVHNTLRKVRCSVSKLCAA